MLELDPQVTVWLALGACALAVSSLLLVVVLALRVRALRRRYDRAFGGAEGAQVVELLGEQTAQIRHLGAELGGLDLRTSELRDQLRGTVSRVGLVRYDAFEDMGGALSFSAALLDERGDGLVISAINGRSETRCYAKPVARASSEHNLSDEEARVIDVAVRGERVPAAPTPVRRRRRSS